MDRSYGEQDERGGVVKHKELFHVSASPFSKNMETQWGTNGLGNGWLFLLIIPSARSLPDLMPCESVVKHNSMELQWQEAGLVKNALILERWKETLRCFIDLE